MKLLLILVAVTCLMLGCSKQTEEAQPKVYDVVVTGNPDGRFINGIKGIREVTGLGLADAKGLFDNLPSVVKTDLSKDEAEAVAELLRASSLSVEIKEK